MDINSDYNSGTLSQSVEYFDSDEYMIVAIRRALVNKQDIVLEAKGKGSILLLGSRSQFFLNIVDEADFFKTELTKVKVTLLREGDSNIPDEHVIGRGVDELLWKAVYHASAGRLMKGYYRDDVVKLEYWPNVTRLPHCSNDIRISALLYHYPTSVSLTSRLLKIELGEVSRFYSAARVAGLAIAVNRSNREPLLEPYRRPYWFKGLFKKQIDSHSLLNSSPIVSKHDN